MKVTPIAGPGQGTADIGSGSTSPDRKAAAKAAYMGEAPPEQETQQPQEQEEFARAARVKRIKMRTQVSTDRAIAPELVQETPQTEQESTLSPTNETVEPEVTRPISPQFAALAKQRRALLVKEQELAKKEKALADQEQLPGSSIDLAKLKSQPLAALKEAGVTYEQLTEEILAEQSGITPEVRALRDEVESLKKGIDDKLSERDQQAERQVLTEMRREADRLVATGDEFEMIRGTKSQSKIIDLIHRNWKASGEVLDVSEAAQLIEDQLVEDSLKMANFGKVRSRLTPEQQAQTQVPRPQQQGIKTLTNRDTAVRPSSARDRAIAAFFGTLKR